MECHDIDVVGSIRVERFTTATFPTDEYYSGRYAFNTDTTKMYYGTGSEWIEIATPSYIQTLTNKTLTQPVIADFTNATHDHSSNAKGGTLAHISETEAHGATGAAVGTTNAQTLTNKTLTQPVISDLTNATHDHSDDANGGLLPLATTGANGLLKQLPDNENQYMNGQGNWSTIDDSSAYPVGTVIEWPYETPPTNYLECNGALLLSTSYPELYSVIDGIYGNEYYGDGSDGDVTISTNTQLSGNMKYNNLVINAGVTLDTYGYSLKVAGTLTNNGTIINTNRIGGTGGAGGAGGAGGNYYAGWLSGAGGAGGAGGYNGGNLLIYSRILNNNGIITASGTNGSTGSGGENGSSYTMEIKGSYSGGVSGGGGGGAGGNGGNGGIIWVVYETMTAEGTIVSSGGAGGAGGTGGAGGSLRCAEPTSWQAGSAGAAGGGTGGAGFATSGIGATLWTAYSGTAGSAGASGTDGTVNKLYRSSVPYFRLPDYRGCFLRGWAHGSTYDPDRATRTDRGDGAVGDNIGTKQLDELKSHTHSLPYTFWLAGVYHGQFDHGGPSLGPSAVSITSTGGNETRPKNIYVMYCIKYQ